MSFAHDLILLHNVRYQIIPKICFGVKAFHLGRAKKTIHKLALEHHLVSLKKNSIVFLSVGEIDCRPDEGIIIAALRRGELPSDVARETVRKYVGWLLLIEEKTKHQFYIFNIAAPKYDDRFTREKNNEVSEIIKVFNSCLAEFLKPANAVIIDVYSMTNDKHGFSSGELFCDNRHLSAIALERIEKQMTLDSEAL